jgi:hypothetical protein
VFSWACQGPGPVPATPRNRTQALYYTCYVGPELRKAERRCSWHAVPARSLERVVWDQIVLALSQPELIAAEARDAAAAAQERLLPMGLSHGARMVCAVPEDGLVRLDDVALDTSAPPYRMWTDQQRLLGGAPALHGEETPRPQREAHQRRHSV